MSRSYIGFSPNNFFYADAMQVNAPFSPTDQNCNKLRGNTFLCDHNNFKDTSFNCLGQVMCKNKELVNSIESLQHSGLEVVGEQYLDDNTSYNNYLLKSINLGIGIAAIIYLSYKN